MECKDRLKIVRSLACVDAAIEACDKDRTVCETLRVIRPDIFTNGGKFECIYICYFFPNYIRRNMEFNQIIFFNLLYCCMSLIL